MKTALNIDDGVMARLKAKAAQRGCTKTELVEAALPASLQERKSGRWPLPLPTFDVGGPPLVDVADRDALHEAICSSRPIDTRPFSPKS